MPGKPQAGGAPYPYPVDYNDHFETPLVAYQDISPLLDWLLQASNTTSSTSGRTKKGDHGAVLYDPYFCDGRTKRILNQLGYLNVVHEKRDFYEDVASNEVPPYDILITNPPYSDQHKIKCLEYCIQQLRECGKPCCILMPNYVAARQYFRKFFEHDASEDFCYLIPQRKYQYDHPMGTGKDNSPFDSLWFCGIGKERMKEAKRFWDAQTENAASAPRIALGLKELEQFGAISTKKRPNPKQRRRRKKHMDGADDNLKESIAASGVCQNLPEKKVLVLADTAVAGSAPMKESKYRDKSGKRKKRRF